METETTIQLDGVEIFVDSRGTGTPVFVLGGPWLGHYYLRQFHDELAKEFSVIAYDPRGSGRSSPLTDNEINLRGHLDDLEGLRRALNVGKMNLVGHSMGALVSLLYSATHTSEVASLVLLHPGPPFDPQMQKELHRAFVSGFTSEDRTTMQRLTSSSLFKAGDAKTHQDYFETLYSPFFADRATLARLQFGFTSTTAQYALSAEERLLPEILAQDPVTMLGRIQCPTLVVHAERDLIPEAFARFLANSIPGSEFVLLEGLGHFGYLEDPGRHIAPTIEFLKRVAK